MKKLLLVLFFTMFPVLAHGATYYVAKTGSNSNACSSAQSQSTPKLTILAGISCLSGGDTLIVRPGVYNEVVDYRYGPNIPNGTPGNPTTLRSEVLRQAVLRPSPGAADPNFTNILSVPSGAHDIILDGFTTDGSLLTVGHCGVCLAPAQPPAVAHDITVKNMEIMNGKDTHDFSGSTGFSHGQITGPPAITAYNLLVSNNKIHNFGGPPGSCNSDGFNPNEPSQVFCAAYGMYLQPANSIIENNEVYDNAGYGIHHYATNDTSTNVTYRGNKVYRNGAVGMLFAAGGRNSTAYNNQVYGNAINVPGAAGMQVGGVGTISSNNTVYNNTFYENQGPGLQLGGGSGPSDTIVRNNITYGNRQDAIIEIATSGTVKSNNIEGSPNPLFVNAAAGDFHLQAGSPAIAVGVVMPDLSFLGSAPDLGALQTGAGGQLPAPANLRLVGN